MTWVVRHRFFIPNDIAPRPVEWPSQPGKTDIQMQAVRNLLETKDEYDVCKESELDDHPDAYVVSRHDSRQGAEVALAEMLLMDGVPDPDQALMRLINKAKDKIS